MKYLMIMVVAMFAISATAQENKALPPGMQKENLPTLFVRQPCKSFPEMVSLIESYGEKLLFTSDFNLVFHAQTGQPFTGGMMFYVNQESGQYSIVNVYADGMACLVGNGRNFNPYGGD